MRGGVEGPMQGTPRDLVSARGVCGHGRGSASVEKPPGARAKDLKSQGRDLICPVRGRRLRVLSGT